MPTLSYQLYCSRNFPEIEDTLAMLAQTGFTECEGYGGLYGDLARLKNALDGTSMKMTSGHFGLDMVENDTAKALEVVKTLGVSRVYVPHLMPADRPTDAAGWAAFGKRLAEAGKPFNDAGVIFGWHNHDFELADLGGADRPLDLIAQGGDDVMLELDLAWVEKGGQSAVDWIKKYAGKITSVHVKDIAPAGECTDEDGWADVGHGTLDWTAINKALKAANVTHYVAEHDNPSDHARFAARSLATMKTF
ncbi:sugar phosphate isomerase/epimerase family protein [Flavimaricola marinus]|uniref:Xylose isomerase-like TIM barrel n=1 Tax=Flavimaricola marinus TaxID=1819565 RepID=A0A238LET1_9RHOB|nr:sugar phosphate isomerase/epimerase [Flavimaricola marinus]SMY08141.1 Xylose isomerase-like TIM barrel [Flavimaricola marinus]